MTEIKRAVDDRLPKWLHSKILSAVDYIWSVKSDDNETMKRVSQVSQVLDGEQMTWVMMLLTLPKLNSLIMKSEDAIEFMKKKNAKRTLQ